MTIIYPNNKFPIQRRPSVYPARAKRGGADPAAEPRQRGLCRAALFLGAAPQQPLPAAVNGRAPAGGPQAKVLLSSELSLIQF